MSDKIQCECGSMICSKNLSSHKKTAKHLKAIGCPIPTSEQPKKEPKKEDMYREYFEEILDDLDTIINYLGIPDDDEADPCDIQEEEEPQEEKKEEKKEEEKALESKQA